MEREILSKDHKIASEVSAMSPEVMQRNEPNRTENYFKYNLKKGDLVTPLISTKLGLCKKLAIDYAGPYSILSLNEGGQYAAMTRPAGRGNAKASRVNVRRLKKLQSNELPCNGKG